MGEYCFDNFYPCLSPASNSTFIVFIAGVLPCGAEIKPVQGRRSNGWRLGTGRRDGDKGGSKRVPDKGSGWPRRTIRR